MKVLTREVLKITFFVLFIILADKFIGKILEVIYFTSKDITISKIRYTLRETSEDILIFGSSRAEHHYIPDIISKSTKRTAYNCGLGGQGLAFSLIQITATLKRYKPNVIILDVSPNILLDKNSDQKLKILGPYYHDIALIRKFLNNGSRYEKLKYTSSIYPYNGLLFDLLLGLVYSSDVSVKGYIPIYGTIDANFIPIEDFGNSHEIPSKQMEYLQEIANICQKDKVDLWILISPIYKTTKEDSKIIHDLRIFAKQQFVHFLDFSQNTNFSNHLMFKDNLHLNSNGAFKYSRIVGDSIPFYSKNI
jgi:hypothetical protein